MAGLRGGFKRFILWDFPRAGWQYDVMVAVILAFVFLTPRAWFRDQPKAASVVMLPAGHGENVFWIEPELLTNYTEADRPRQAGAVLKARTGRVHTLVRLEPIFGAEHEIKGFMAYTTP